MLHGDEFLIIWSKIKNDLNIQESVQDNNEPMEMIDDEKDDEKRECE